MDIFFVLSGFLITGLLFREWEQAGSVDLKEVLRPAGAASASGLADPGAGVSSGVHAPSRGWAVSAALAGRARLDLVCIELGEGIRPDRDELPAAHLVLGIEEQFYTLWPLALLALLGTRNRRFWTIVVVCAGIVGSAALRAVTWQGRESLLRDYYSLETRLGRISYGVYLWHSPIQTGVLGEARLLRLGVPSALRVVLPFLATIAVAAASFYLLEQPILRANARRRERIAAAQTLRRGTAN